MLIVSGLRPLPFDCYLLRFPKGSVIKPHVDKVQKGNHYRCNFILRNASIGGVFKCANNIFESKRIKFFRPDIEEHSVTEVKAGTRYVLSFGWLRS